MTANHPCNVLILGGSGFIGGRLDRHLAENGWNVRALSSRNGNLLDAAAARRSLGPARAATSVVMCSAVSRLEDDSWNSFQKNVAMVRHLLAALEADPPRSIVYLSSVDVYGLPAAELPIRESTPTRATTFYGLSKLSCELRFQAWQRMVSPVESTGSTVPISLLRLPGVYGPGDGGRSVVGRFCDHILRRRPLQVRNEGRTRRDFLHVDDLVEAMVALLRNPIHGLFNVATGNSLPIARLIELIAGQTGCEPHIEPLPRADRDHDLEFDTQRLTATLPGVRFRSVEQGLLDYLSRRPATR